jgi:hypothetical protein
MLKIALIAIGVVIGIIVLVLVTATPRSTQGGEN